MPHEIINHEDGSMTYRGIDFVLECLPNGVKFWIRNNVPYNGAPKQVQFCKLRGRINDVYSCYGAPGPCGCYEVE